MAEKFTCTVWHTFGGYCGPGFLYVARDGDDYKVGCTKAEGTARHKLPSSGELAGVYARLWSLRHETRREFRLVHVIFCPVCVRSFEREVHQLLGRWRPGRAELFRLPGESIGTLMALTHFAGYPLRHIEVH